MNTGSEAMLGTNNDVSARTAGPARSVRDGGLYLAVGALLLVLLAGPWLAPHDPVAVELGAALQPPSWAHPAGTDQLGRDVLSRILTGGRTTVGITLVSLLGAMLVGVPIGLYSGFLGGRTDWAWMRVSDGFMSFPEYVVAIVLTGLMGPGFLNLVVAIVLVKWVGYTRLVRSVVIQEKTQDYLLVSKVSGSSTTGTITRHLIAHIAGPVLSLAALDIGKIVLLVASLSFLGLGVPQPSPEWGAMLNEGRTYFARTSTLMLFPGLAIFVVVLLTNLAGDRLAARFSTLPTLQGATGEPTER